MSASMLIKLCGRFRSVRFCQNCRTIFSKCASGKPKTFLYTSLLTVFAANKNEGVKEKLEPPDPSKLTHGYLIRNAASQTVDNVSILITQTALSIIETEAIFRDSANLLSELLEYKLTVLGNETEENRVWDTILAVRAKLNAAKHKRQELDMLMVSVEKLVHDAGEVAFISGAEYSATCSAERLQSAQIQISMVREASATAERRLQFMEITVMEATAKYEQDTKHEQDATQKNAKQKDTTQDITQDTKPKDAKQKDNEQKDIEQTGIEQTDIEQTDIEQTDTDQTDSDQKGNEQEKEDLDSPVVSSVDNSKSEAGNLFTSSTHDASSPSEKKEDHIFASSKYYDPTYTEDDEPTTNFYASDSDDDAGNLHF